MSFNPWKELWEDQQANQQADRHSGFWLGFLLGAVSVAAGGVLTLQLLGVL